MSFTIRPANIEDIRTLEALIDRSAKVLCAPDYTPEQIEGALRGAFGVDTQLIRDQTYFAVEEAANDPSAGSPQIIGCGGWSYRKTLFGSDQRTERDPAELDPATDAAKIRAFFIDPDHSRRGIGRALLEHCEQAAIERGFRRLEMMATLTGARLYERFGYRGESHIEYPVGDGLTIEFIPMWKTVD